MFREVMPSSRNYPGLITIAETLLSLCTKKNLRHSGHVVPVVTIRVLNLRDSIHSSLNFLSLLLLQPNCCLLLVDCRTCGELKRLASVSAIAGAFNLLPDFSACFVSSYTVRSSVRPCALLLREKTFLVSANSDTNKQYT